MISKGAFPTKKRSRLILCPQLAPLLNFPISKKRKNTKRAEPTVTAAHCPVSDKWSCRIVKGALGVHQCVPQNIRNLSILPPIIQYRTCAKFSQTCTYYLWSKAFPFTSSKFIS